MKTKRPPKKVSRKKRRRKPFSKWKKSITAEASRKSRAKSKPALPDTSAIRWL